MRIAQVKPRSRGIFLERRTAEAQMHLRKRLFADELNNQVLAAKRAKQESDAAVAELKRAKDAIKDYENIRECRYAMKTYTALARGDGSANAGGAGVRKRRLEVLDRMARIGAGLSAGQKTIGNGSRTRGMPQWLPSIKLDGGSSSFPGCKKC